MYGSKILRILRNVILTGLAIVLPLFITLYIIWFVIQWIGQSIVPVVNFLEEVGVIGFFARRELIVFLIETGIYGSVIDVLSEIIAVLLFFMVIVLIGAIARYRYGEFLVSTFDYLIASVPGIGTVYQTLRRVGKMVAGENMNEFEAVKLVEMLSSETYLIAFQTGSSPQPVRDATDNEDMITLFVPMAPNPVTGGFLIYVSRDRVVDVDLSIDEAVGAILTSGLATDDGDDFGTDSISDRPSPPGVATGDVALSESDLLDSDMDISIQNTMFGSRIHSSIDDEPQCDK